METPFYEFYNNLPPIVPDILMALLIFFGSLFLASFMRNLLKKVLKSRKVDLELNILLGQLLYWGIISFGIISALGRFFDVTAFVAGLGILGFTIGFALQDIMQNFVAGIILLIQQPFNVGETVETAGYTGTILDISIRTTEMQALDGRLIIIPNAQILANPITNFSDAHKRRVELPVGISYDADHARARKTILDAIIDIPGVLEDPAPKALLHTFGGSSIDLTVYFWIDPVRTDMLTAKDSAVTKVKAALDKQGIEIPFPIQTIYMQK
ncbi:MAG: mechanosensitive ion channel [Anaerolineales bacterium]|nr:mechanosensitive ion channel [Anaerolineales bacterium]